MRGLAAVAVAGLVAASACGARPDEGRTEAQPAAVPVGAPEAPPASVLPSSTVRPPSTTPRRRLEPVTLAFAGDTYFEGSLGRRLARDPATVLAEVAPLLSGADLTVVNLEAAVTERGDPEPKTYAFRAPPAGLEALRAAGIDAASLANNHGLDFGEVSLGDALAAERATGFPLLGIGADEASAYAPQVVAVRGTRIALLAATQVLDGNLVGRWTARDDHGGLASAKREDRLLAEVRAARAVADTVVVFIHWGRERVVCPTEDQRDLAADLAAAGADVVVGSHAHALLGGGFLDGAFVHYGLGNFAFNAIDEEGERSGVLTVTVRGPEVEGYRWAPVRIDDRVPRPLSGPEADAARADWESRRACTGLTP